MNPDSLILFCIALTIIAFLYSSVGHAGASGYIAVMALSGLSAQTIKPLALVLNIVVAIVTTYNFLRLGHFSWKIFIPLAITSVPLAFLGGYLKVPDHFLKILIGLVLLFSSARFFFYPKEPKITIPPPRGTSLACGGFLGLLSGLTGTGGGIFLTPLLLHMKWAKIKTAAGISALFILVNSAAGLAGHTLKTKDMPPFIFAMMICVLVGGATGSYLGSNRYKPEIIKRCLALVLLIAGLKLIFFS
ncbi:MAG: sulfite exporter TauE/SafE family protein [Verrucomicrobiota bacterium]|nr:sulfite exporter TauE/SafE family protein [Verrucomicrobiota bacterium]